MGKKIDLAPYIIKQSSQDGKLSSEDLGIGLDIYSKYGTVGLSKNKNTQSYDGQGSLKTKSKNITYGKNFKVGDSSSITLEGNYGKSKNKYSDNTTKGGKVTFRKSFNQGGEADTKVEIYLDKEGRRRRRLVPINTTDPDQRPRSKTNKISEPVGRPRESLPIDPKNRIEKKRIRKSKPKRPIGFTPMEPRGNPAVVETYEDARENQMINRDVPTMKHGGEAKTRGMGCAIKGGKFQGVF
jgi:hypothetical protein